MNGVTLLGLSAKESSESCELSARAVSERVIRFSIGLKLNTARTVGCVLIKERTAAASRADVGRCTEFAIQ